MGAKRCCWNRIQRLIPTRCNETLGAKIPLNVPRNQQWIVLGLQLLVATKIIYINCPILRKQIGCPFWGTNGVALFEGQMDCLYHGLWTPFVCSMIGPFWDCSIPGPFNKFILVWFMMWTFILVWILEGVLEGVTADVNRDRGPPSKGPFIEGQTGCPFWETNGLSLFERRMYCLYWGMVALSWWLGCYFQFMFQCLRATCNDGLSLLMNKWVALFDEQTVFF